MTIADAVAALGPGPLTEEGLKQNVWPLFSRVLKRDEIYLANHSLGRPLDQTARDVQEALDLWYTRLDGVWDADGWPTEMTRFRSAIAQLVGLSRADAVVPKTSAGQGLRAVLNALESPCPKVVATRSEFDSVDFILKTYQARGRAEVEWVEPAVREGIPWMRSVNILSRIRPGVDLVVLSLVFFGTGQVLGDLEELMARSHEVGARVLVDAYHAAGVIPISMEALGCDFMVGGSYKYVRGGPGACWLAIHPRVLESGLQTLDTGWFAKRSPFEFDRSDRPERAAGGDGWLESTPAILPLYQARAGLELTLAMGVERLREYNLRQQATLRSEFRKHGVPFFDPPNPADFGAFTLLPSVQAGSLCVRLKERGINVDSRNDNVRFGPDLLTTESELGSAANVVADLMRGTSAAGYRHN